jgi:hypothetical protein
MLVANGQGAYQPNSQHLGNSRSHTSIGLLEILIAMREEACLVAESQCVLILLNDHMTLACSFDYDVSFCSYRGYYLLESPE